MVDGIGLLLIMSGEQKNVRPRRPSAMQATKKNSLIAQYEDDVIDDDDNGDHVERDYLGDDWIPDEDDVSSSSSPSSPESSSESSPESSSRRRASIQETLVDARLKFAEKKSSTTSIPPVSFFVFFFSFIINSCHVPHLIRIMILEMIH